MMSAGANNRSNLQLLRARLADARESFLTINLELSYTLATFGDTYVCSEPLRNACYRAARQGYSTAVKMLPRQRVSGDAQNVERLLGKVRSALAVLETGIPPSAEAGQPEPEPVPDKSVDAGMPVLTRREMQVLQCIAAGFSTKELAWRLGITFKTAACHRYRVMAKLDIHDVASLVRYVVRHGLIGT